MSPMGPALLRHHELVRQQDGEGFQAGFEKEAFEAAIAGQNKKYKCADEIGQCLRCARSFQQKSIEDRRDLNAHEIKSALRTLFS